MDQRMDGWTDRASYRDVRMHLKTTKKQLMGLKKTFNKIFRAFSPEFNYGSERIFILFFSANFTRKFSQFLRKNPANLPVNLYLNLFLRATLSIAAYKMRSF